MLEIVSLIAGVVSVILAIVAIFIAITQCKESTENYKNAQILMSKIDRTTELMEQNIKNQEVYLLAIINKLLDKLGEPRIDAIMLKEIEEQLKGI